MSPAVSGRKRCRMHGGKNPGAGHGNRNARKAGNRTREAEEQLKLIRRSSRDLRLASKLSRGEALRPAEIAYLFQLQLDLSAEE